MCPRKISSVQSTQPNLFDIADAAEYKTLLKKYRNTFARDHQGPYAIQWPGKTWKTKYKPVSDPLLKAHLTGLYSIATKASWYPVFYFLDIDSPGPDTIARIVEALGLREGQYQLMTSPSYADDGSLHLVIMLIYRDKLPTHNLGYTALTNTLGRLCEIYPQLRRKFRLPLGRGQRLIDKDGAILKMPWQQAMYWLDKLDPVQIETLTFQPLLPFPSLAKNEDNPRNWAKSEYVRDLFKHGLQDFNVRHRGQWDIAVSLWRANWQPVDAIVTLKEWIRTKHNGFSKNAICGNWRIIDGEIFRQVQWIWAHFRHYPDGPHNLDGYITMADLKWITQVYPGDIVNQKRLCALASYMRPRVRHDYVYVPARVWRDEIANDRTYHAFRQDLEAKGLLESNMSYRHVEGVPERSYSRKFKLQLPSTSYEPIQIDGRNEQDYYEALRLTLGSVKEMVAFTGVTNQRFYQALGDKMRLSDLESTTPAFTHHI